MMMRTPFNDCTSNLQCVERRKRYKLNNEYYNFNYLKSCVFNSIAVELFKCIVYSSFATSINILLISSLHLPAIFCFLGLCPTLFLNWININYISIFFLLFFSITFLIQNALCNHVLLMWNSCYSSFTSLL